MQASGGSFIAGSRLPIAEKTILKVLEFFNVSQPVPMKLGFAD
jgi:hypothetical protein